MGKVHGSLARAGKVKSATPKVSSSCSSLNEVLISAVLLGRVYRRHRKRRDFEEDSCSGSTCRNGRDDICEDDLTNRWFSREIFAESEC
jgi:hypothetical protein